MEQENKLYISSSVSNNLPSMIRNELSKMSAQKQEEFVEEYKRKAKSVGISYLFILLIFGMHYGYLKNWGLQLVYWITLGGFGIWFIIDLFRLPGLVKDYNKDGTRTTLMHLIGNNRLANRLACSLLVLILFLFCAASALGQEKKVLIIGIDGLMPEAVGLPGMSNINSLYQDGEGFLTYGYTEDLTFSGPSWSSILHGVHRDRHGVDSNRYHGHDFSDYPHVLMRLKAHHPDLYTAAFVTWSLLQNNFSDPDGTPMGVDELVYHASQTGGDEMVTNDLVELLESGDPDAVFYYQNDIDGAGHGYGFSIDVPEYREQLRVTDARVGRVLDALGNRQHFVDGLEEWLIILVTDHGGVGTGHSGNLYRQRFIPLIVSKVSMNRQGALGTPPSPLVRSRNVDVTRTVLSYMGVPEAEFSELDGHNLLALSEINIPESGYGANLLFNGDGEFDRGFTDRLQDQAITGWRVQEHTGHKDGYHSMTIIKTPSEIRHIRSDSSIRDASSSNLFTGGRKGVSSKMTQLLDLSNLQDDIDSRCVNFLFSGYLGGTGRSEDRMEASVTFLDENGDVIDSGVLETVSQKDRVGETVLIYRETEGFVSPGTRSALIELLAIGVSEVEKGIQALADQVSFELSCKKQKP